MSQDDTLQSRYASQVTDLANALAANDEAAFRGAFERLRGAMNAEMNPELKRIASTAQDALRRFREQARLEVLADQEVPDARRRLSHVVKDRLLANYPQIKDAIIHIEPPPAG